jgi:hypothetical protein
MNMASLEHLVIKRINRMKKEMIKTAYDTGLNSIETLHCSQELDKLINLHLKYFSKRAYNNFSVAV